LRGFDLQQLEEVIRYSGERYADAATGRRVAVGKHGRELVMIPFEEDGEAITPVTVHATTRQQISYRIKSGRLTQ
jgi:hypothetical protein